MNPGPESLNDWTSWMAGATYLAVIAGAAIHASTLIFEWKAFGKGKVGQFFNALGGQVGLSPQRHPRRTLRSGKPECLPTFDFRRKEEI